MGMEGIGARVGSSAGGGELSSMIGNEGRGIVSSSLTSVSSSTSVCKGSRSCGGGTDEESASRIASSMSPRRTAMTSGGVLSGALVGRGGMGRDSRRVAPEGVRGGGGGGGAPLPRAPMGGGGGGAAGIRGPLGASGGVESRGGGGAADILGPLPVGSAGGAADILGPLGPGGATLGGAAVCPASEARSSVAARLSSSARVASPACEAESTARFSQTIAS
jgi:hypothetical protein